MSPGMNEAEKKEEQFNANISRLPAGEKTGDEGTDEDYRLNVEFARKIRESQSEPSESFRVEFKRRLLSKLAEKEVAEAQRQTKVSSFWGLIRNLVPKTPVWQAIAVTVPAVVLALVIVWRMGLLFPGQEPIVVAPPPTSNVAVEVRANTGDRSYMVGEDVQVHFSLKNITAERLNVFFPPAFTITDSNGEDIKFFNPGQDTRELEPGIYVYYDLSWDQKDNGGNQVIPGDYQVIMVNTQLGGDKGLMTLIEVPTITVLSKP